MEQNLFWNMICVGIFFHNVAVIVTVKDGRLLSVCNIHVLFYKSNNYFLNMAFYL